MTEIEMASAHGNIKAAEALPEPWIARFADRIPPGGAVLDLAAGGGRNGRLFLARGHAVTFIDRDAGALSDLAGPAGAEMGAEVIEADMESGPPVFSPGGALAGRTFVGVVCVNYLHRPLLAPLPADVLTGLPGALAPGGVLLYSTFMAGNEKFGRPSNPDYLLRPGELLEYAGPDMRAIAFEEGPVTREDGTGAVRQSIAAARRAADFNRHPKTYAVHNLTVPTF